MHNALSERPLAGTDARRDPARPCVLLPEGDRDEACTNEQGDLKNVDLCKNNFHDRAFPTGLLRGVPRCPKVQLWALFLIYINDLEGSVASNILNYANYTN